MWKDVNRKKIDLHTLLCLSLLCLSWLCAAGCGKRNVDYIVDEQENTDTSESMHAGEYAGGNLWEESFAVEREDGDSVTVKVRTTLSTGPDTSQVIEIKRMVLDEEARERIAKAALGDEASLENGVYTGSRDGIPFQMRIGERRISLYPTDTAQAQLASENLKGALGFSFEAGGGIYGGGNEDETPEEEAAEIAAQFLEDIGFSDRILSNAKTLYWTGRMELLGEDWWSTMSVLDGYIFYFEQALQGESVTQLAGDTNTDDLWLWQEGNEFDGIYDMKMHTIVCVKDHQVVAADIWNIYEITSIEDDVSLLPIQTVQGILQKELAEPDDYNLDVNGSPLLYYWGLNFGYCLIWDEAGEEGSYVPIWELFGGNTDYTNITVNAIDGSIVTWEQKNQGLIHRVPEDPETED